MLPRTPFSLHGVISSTRSCSPRLCLKLLIAKSFFPCMVRGPMPSNADHLVFDGVVMMNYLKKTTNLPRTLQLRTGKNWALTSILAHLGHGLMAHAKPMNIVSASSMALMDCFPTLLLKGQLWKMLLKTWNLKLFLSL